MSGPLRTGSVEPFTRADGTTYFRGRVRLGDSSRKWIDVPDKYSTPAGGKTARERAELYVAARQEREDETGELLAEKRAASQKRSRKEAEEHGETWSQWHRRYLEVHEALGKDTRGMKTSAATWLAALDRQPMASVTREQIVTIRDAMTAAVLAGRISAKRAMNMWSDLVVAPFSRAFTDDDPRYSNVRAGPASANPASGVKPPVSKEQLDEDRRERQPMYPHEFVRLMSCEAISIPARRIYALAVYLYLRPQELYALRWTDIDWTAREVRIRRKLDVRSGEEKAGTKSDAGVREVPIHEHLIPLLEAMHGAASSDDERIVPLIGAARLFERFADQTRRHLKLAKIDRDELVDGSADLMPFDFRSWRTTGCTWLAMLGTDSYVIALQAGHKSPDTTWGSYIKRGPDLRQRYGEPFPPLPPELVSEANRAKHRAKLEMRRETTGNSAERAGFEPGQDVDLAANTNRLAPTESTRVGPSTRIAVDVGPTLGPSGLLETRDAVDPLEEALRLAAKAGRFDVVAQLARELEARRLARSENVVDITTKRRGR